MGHKSLRFCVFPVLFVLALRLDAQDTIRFAQGLIIQPGIDYGRTPVQYDPVARRILDGIIGIPLEGDRLDLPGEEDPAWEKSVPEEDGYFRSPKFRGGYLYLEYNSPEETVMILDATGHTMAFVNGIPREGDHYNFSYSQLPVRIKKGLNQFFFTGGRFPMIRAMLIRPESRVILSGKDLTLPDLIIGEGDVKWGAIRVINLTDKDLRGLVIRSSIAGHGETVTEIPAISPMTLRKVGFRIQDPDDSGEGKTIVYLKLADSKGRKGLDDLEFEIENKQPSQMIARTFISTIDGSVQYFAVRPGNIPEDQVPALFFSVHGAGVEARNQARAYQPKDWGHVIAPTNRRPFGFAWEDWGRLDALEVLEIGKKMYRTDPERTYLTGHSMGGHGTWYLGATYPDQFAAIAPCAGYADLLLYAVRSEDEQEPSPAVKMFTRAANPHRTKELSRNYLHFGIYILHGDADETVPVSQARAMRELLGTFHNNFTYYEYPGGSHWYGDISMDWPPIFEYFRLHTLKDPEHNHHIEFHTASPGVSSTSGWLTLYAQENPYEFSSIDITRDPSSGSFAGTTRNVSCISLNLSELQIKDPVDLVIDSQQLNGLRPDPGSGSLWLEKKNNTWSKSLVPGKFSKGPHRYGNFKDAFRHRMVFVYGTRGTKDENEWMYYKARFDAETFGYRGNGSVEVIRDSEFNPSAYADRNVILYGNETTNTAWQKLLKDCPVKVMTGKIMIGEKELKGNDIGCYFIWPRKESGFASVGVVAGTGLPGLKATYANQYFLAGPGFPDLAVFRSDMPEKQYDAIECAGFFGSDWSIKNGDFVWKNR